MQSSYPMAIPSDFFTLLGFFILLHEDREWYLLPVRGIHTKEEEDV